MNPPFDNALRRGENNERLWGGQRRSEWCEFFCSTRKGGSGDSLKHSDQAGRLVDRAKGEELSSCQTIGG